MLTFLYPLPYQLSLQFHSELQFNLLSDLEGRKYIKNKKEQQQENIAGKARVLFFVKRLMFLNSQETLLAILTTFFFFKLKKCDLGETQGKHFSSFSSQNRGRNKAGESVDE